MHIDLDQLPIPQEWDLRCPHCDYLLAGTGRHECPECGEPFDVHKLVGTWSRLRDPVVTGDELPFPACGLTCRGCHAKLDGVTEHRCAQCGRAFDPVKFKPTTKWFRVEPWMHHGIPLPVVGALLADAYLPYVHHPQTDALIIADSMGMIEVQSDFYFEFLWLMQQRRRGIREAADEQAASASGDSAWQCAACDEQNPAGFEVCWNCGRESDAAV